MAQIDATGDLGSFDAFALASIDHNTFIAGSPTSYQWRSTNNFFVTALSATGDITFPPAAIGGTANAINITDSGFNPILNITGISLPLAGLIDTADAAAMQEKFWEAALAGATTILAPNEPGHALRLMGDFVAVNAGQTVAGGDDAFVGGKLLGSNDFTGDAGRVEAGATLNGGDDVFDNVSGGQLAGDVGFGGIGVVPDNAGTVNGGNDTFTLVDTNFFPVLSLGPLAGDVLWNGFGGIVNGGADAITLRNIVSVFDVSGDVRTQGGAGVGGNDTVLIETTVPGTTFAFANDVAGDYLSVSTAGGALAATGGNDSLTLRNVNGSTLSGDFRDINAGANPVTAAGGDDTITLAGTFALTVPPPSFQITPSFGTIAGDVVLVNGLGSFAGGDDVVNVTNATFGTVEGDAGTAATESFNGGSDTITVLFDRGNTSASVVVHGDANISSSVDFVGGDDFVSVTTRQAPPGPGPQIFGDAFSYTCGADGAFTGGDDVLASNSGALQNAVIFGDASTLTAAGKLDVIWGNDRLIGDNGADILFGDASTVSAASGLTQSGGIDTLDGRGGNDVLSGGFGIDTAVFSLAQSVYVDLNGIPGAGLVDAIGQGNDQLLEVENLTGSSKNDVLIGNDLGNTLDGSGGADILQGRLGDDTFFVDNGSDRIIEALGGGDDRVITTVSFAATPGSEIELLRTAGILTTTPIDLVGNSIGQTLQGNAADNILNGAAGADIMEGNGGDDTYFVDNAGDAIVETTGDDRVITTVNYTLNAGAQVELLRTPGIATTDPINLTGNEFAQMLQGNAAANTLDGKGGADILQGLAGDDTYFVDAGDQVFEAVGGGNDRILTNTSFTVTAGAEIELLRTFGSVTTNAINLVGNSVSQKLEGNSGDNLLDGAAGNDTIQTFSGHDIVRFDTALGASNVDLVLDFDPANDTIQLDNAVFAGLAAGTLLGSAFRTGAAAADADDRIVYNNADGSLFFDADGSGAGAAVRFAVLATHPALTAADFFVV